MSNIVCMRFWVFSLSLLALAPLCRADDSIQPLLPADYTQPSLKNGLIAPSRDGSTLMGTKWGNIPTYETLTPGTYYEDDLPVTTPIVRQVYDDMEVSKIIKSLTAQMGISFIMPPKLEGKLTATFNNTSPTDILRAVCMMQGLEVTKVFGSYTVAERKQVKGVLRRYRLSYNFVDSAEVQAMGVSTSGGGGGGGGGGKGGSSGGGGGGGGGFASSSNLKVDYQAFVKNVENLAKEDYGMYRSKTGEVLKPEDSKVIYDADTRVLFIKCAPAGHEAVLTYLETINRPQENIGLEIFVAETSLDPREDLGLDWSPTAAGGYTVGYDPKNVNGFSGINGSSISADKISATFRALKKDSAARSYQHPQVITTNNRAVTLQSYVEVPFTQSSSSVSSGAAGSTNTASTDFKNVGISIGVLPVLQDNGIIRMKVSISNSTLQGTDSTTGQPITSVRAVGNSWSMKEGDWMVIGGLGENQFIKSSSGIWGLSSLPGIGRLFGSTSVQNTTKHMLIFVRPTVFSNLRKGLAVSSMGKSALFTDYRPDTLNMNSTDIYGGKLSEIEDPFASHAVQHSIITLKSKETEYSETLKVLDADKTRKVSELDTQLDVMSKESQRICDALRGEQDAKKMATMSEKRSILLKKLVELEDKKKRILESYEGAKSPVKERLDEVRSELKKNEGALADSRLSEAKSMDKLEEDLIVARRLKVDNPSTLVNKGIIEQEVVGKPVSPDTLTFQPAVVGQVDKVEQLLQSLRGRPGNSGTLSVKPPVTNTAPLPPVPNVPAEAVVTKSVLVPTPTVSAPSVNKGATKPKSNLLEDL